MFVGPLPASTISVRSFGRACVTFGGGCRLVFFLALNRIKNMKIHVTQSLDVRHSTRMFP